MRESFDDKGFQGTVPGDHIALGNNEVLQNLRQDALSVEEKLKLSRKDRIAKRQTTGFVYMVVGAFLGFLSCVFTITNLFPGATGFVLYGLTSIAVLLVVAGLYFVFE